MPNTKDLAGSLFPLKVLLYGGSGVGKTLFAATFPKAFIINTENGLKTLRGLDRHYEDVFEDDKARPTAYSRVVKLVSEIGRDLTIDDTLILDSYTVLNDYAVNFAAALAGHGGSLPSSYAEWRQVLTLMLDLTDRLIRLKCNVVCTAHEDVFKDELLMAVLVRPFFTGQSQGKIPHKFDEVYRLHTGFKGEYLIKTCSDARVFAKSRLNRTGILEPDILWTWDEKNPDTNPVFEAVKRADQLQKSSGLIAKDSLEKSIKTSQ